jgi:hypothetical protein
MQHFSSLQASATCIINSKVKYLFMRENIDDFFDDAETEIFQISKFLDKVTFRPKR